MLYGELECFSGASGSEANTSSLLHPSYTCWYICIRTMAFRHVHLLQWDTGITHTQALLGIFLISNTISSYLMVL